MSLRDLDAHFRAALGDSSSRAVARHLGESETGYQRALQRDAATLATVRRWIAAWEGAGHPAVSDAVIARSVRAGAMGIREVELPDVSG